MTGYLEKGSEKMLKKSAIALSAATLAVGAAILPAAVAKAEGPAAQQVAAGEQTKPKVTTPTGQSNPCAAGDGGCHHGPKPQTS